MNLSPHSVLAVESLRLDKRRGKRNSFTTVKFLGRSRQLYRPTCQPFLACAVRRSCRDRPSTRSRSEEHTSELQSLMRSSYAVFCLKKKKQMRTEYRQVKRIR